MVPPPGLPLMKTNLSPEYGVWPFSTGQSDGSGGKPSFPAKNERGWKGVIRSHEREGIPMRTLDQQESDSTRDSRRSKRVHGLVA